MQFIAEGFDMLPLIKLESYKLSEKSIVICVSRDFARVSQIPRERWIFPEKPLIPHLRQIGSVVSGVMVA